MAKTLTYKDSGVDIAAGDALAQAIGKLARSTFSPRVVKNEMGFAGLFRLDYNERLFKKNYRDPVLLACTDGVGTKLKLAIELKKFDTVGIDLVAMSVNDLIVQAAEPMFFLDYLAVGKVDKQVILDLLKGICQGCRQASAALLGGETAEMPDFYAPGEFDLAGFAVGVVERRKLITGSEVEPGDAIIGLASSGIHSNGYSLVRKIITRTKKTSPATSQLWAELWAKSCSSPPESTSSRSAESWANIASSESSEPWPTSPAEDCQGISQESCPKAARLCSKKTPGLAPPSSTSWPNGDRSMKKKCTAFSIWESDTFSSFAPPLPSPFSVGSNAPSRSPTSSGKSAKDPGK